MSETLFKTPAVLPFSELVYPIMKQTVMLLWFFINVLSHPQSHLSFIARFSAAFLFILALTYENCCQVPPWYLSEVWGRAKWGLTDIQGVKERGGTRVGVGQMLARLSDYVPLLCSTCRVWLVQDFDKFGKSCHFLTEAWPQGGWSYQNASVSRGVTSLRLNKRGGVAIK